MRLMFGQWLPDLPANKNPGALVAKNVIPEIESYRAFRGLSSFSSALDSPALSSIWARGADGSIFNFAGNSTKLYRLINSVTWDDVSRPAGYVAADWDFTAYGNRVIAANGSANLQYYDMGTSSLFADLPNAPVLRYVTVVRDFVVGGHTDSDPATVQWSGLNNSEQWAASAATQAGSQALKTRGGPIKGVVGGDVGFIFQERSITRMSYIGPALIFRFDEIEKARGTPASGSIAQTGTKIYYYSTDGFYMIDTRSGTDSRPIGNNRVNNWFRAEADFSQLSSMRSAVDRENSLVIWAFKSNSSSSNNDRLLIYNWQADRWSYAEAGVQTLAEYAAPGLTLDQLDTVLPGGPDVDTISVDDPVFAGGAISLLAFDSQNRAGTFAGAVLTYCIDTSEFSAPENKYTFISSVVPIAEVSSFSSMSITPISRNRIMDNPIVQAASAVDAEGKCDIRDNARYHRYRLTGDSLITHATGVEFEISTVGTQ